MPEQVDWWNADGSFTKGDIPVELSDVEQEDWKEVLRKANYHLEFSHGEIYINFELNIYFHETEPHSYVEMRYGDLVVSFFVKAELRTYFLTTWLLKYLRDSATWHQATSIDLLRKTLVAFVRYGQGEDTINAEGDQTLDDWHKQQEAIREWEKNKKKNDN